MKSILLTLCLAGAAAGAFGADAAPGITTATPKPDKKKVSYSFGMQYGNFLKRNSVDIDLEEFTKAVNDILAGKPAMDEKESQEVMNAFRTEMMAKQQAKARELGEKNEKEGTTFLEANAKKEGVKVTASGLQYKVIKEGTGAKPTATDTVVTHYKGTLIDGSEFDSSYSRGEPATFPVNGVIGGWTEALQLMPVGSKWQLFIPSKLAYKERGSGQKIGPNATLIFDIELLDIKKAEAPKPVTSDIIKVPSADELKKGAKIEVIKDVDAEIKRQKAEQNKPK
ncbi:MAG TPA: peptidylprolyl isomerase [Verrucomicrobiales bacterium]|nr:peptidylprolyl isomerase [Verrucomicrobiales bacterium]